jgi:5-methylthioadenosine/S-adenosylhomocysteine deaminase
MATYNGALALGISEKVGSLEPGKLADIVSIDLSSPECLPVFDPVSTLVYSTGAKVSQVWIGGRRMVKDGEVVADVGLDVAQVKAVGRELKKF